VRPAPAAPGWSLTLYVSGASPRSAAAVEAVRTFCRQELAGPVDLEVVDVRDEPERVVADQVQVVPTLIKRRPPPLRRIAGDLEDLDRLRAELDLAPAASVEADPTGQAPPP
jgi:circadian clock protein KaiB